MSDTPPPGSNGLINSGYILPSVPFVNPKTGVITPIWWRFLAAVLARTGGPTGVVTADVELIAALGLAPDEAPDLSDLLLALRGSDSDLAAAIGDEVALALAAQTVGDVVPDDVLPAAEADVLPSDDLLPLLLAPDDDAAAFADGWTWGVGATALVMADTYTLCGFASFAGAITAMRAVVGPAAVGALTETVKINGTAVTGINGVNVNAATVQTFAATGASSFVVGDLIQLTIAIGSGLPVGAWSTIQYVKAPQ